LLSKTLNTKTHRSAILTVVFMGKNLFSEIKGRTYVEDVGE